MQRRMFTLGLLVSVALMLLLTPAAFAGMGQKMQSQKQSPKPKQNVIELKGTKATTRGGEADPNITNDTQTNDPSAKVQPPSSKGGPKTRGGADCEVRLDNRTGLYIKIYVDGSYRGTLAPYGDAVVYVLPGETHVYGRADYTDGSYSYWGPKAYDCGPGQYIYFKMTE